MANLKKNKNSETGKETAGANSFWRKPITLDSFEDDDPLAALYRGREVSDSTKNVEESPKNSGETNTEFADKKTKISEKPAASTLKQKKPAVEKTLGESKNISEEQSEKSANARSTRITEEELKNILKIKSDSFQFTDIREILRGKSFDIYVYLRFLSSDAGVCKIKHLDLMKKLDISRPTLFKQGDWLKRLSLIEKRNVPGDHLGTSYTVHPLEDVLPISESLIRQIQSEIENYERETN